jgi:hypothetical protein
VKSELLLFLLFLLIVLTLFFETFQYIFVDFFGLFVGRDTSGQAEITYFNFLQVLTYKNILWFEVTVEYFGRLQVLEGTDNLIENPLDLLIIKLVDLFGDLLKVHWQVFKGHGQSLEVFLIFRRQDLINLNDLGEIDDAQQCYLAQSSESHKLVIKKVFELLDGNNLPSLFVDCFVNIAVCSAADEVFL